MFPVALEPGPTEEPFTLNSDSETCTLQTNLIKKQRLEYNFDNGKMLTSIEYNLFEKKNTDDILPLLESLISILPNLNFEMISKKLQKQLASLILSSPEAELRLLAVKAISSLAIDPSILEAYLLPADLQNYRNKLLLFEKLQFVHDELMLSVFIGSLLWTPFRPFQDELLSLFANRIHLIKPDLFWSIWAASIEGVTSHGHLSHTDQIQLQLLISLISFPQCIYHLFEENTNSTETVRLSELERFFLSCWDGITYSSPFSASIPTPHRRFLCMPLLRLLSLISRSANSELTTVLTGRPLCVGNSSFQLVVLDVLAKRDPPNAPFIREIKSLIKTKKGGVELRESLPSILKKYSLNEAMGNILISFLFGQLSVASSTSTSLQKSNRKKIVSAVVSFLPIEPYWQLFIDRAAFFFQTHLAQFEINQPSEEDQTKYPLIRETQIIGFLNLMEEFCSQAGNLLSQDNLSLIFSTLCEVLKYKYQNSNDRHLEPKFPSEILQLASQVESSETEKIKGKRILERSFTLLACLAKLSPSPIQYLELNPIIYDLLSSVPSSKASFLFGIQLAVALLPHPISITWLTNRLDHINLGSEHQLETMLAKILIPLLSLSEIHEPLLLKLSKAILWLLTSCKNILALVLDVLLLSPSLLTNEISCKLLSICIHELDSLSISLFRRSGPILAFLTNKHTPEAVKLQKLVSVIGIDYIMKVLPPSPRIRVVLSILGNTLEDPILFKCSEVIQYMLAINKATELFEARTYLEKLELLLSEVDSQNLQENGENIGIVYSLVIYWLKWKIISEPKTNQSLLSDLFPFLIRCISKCRQCSEYLDAEIQAFVEWVFDSSLLVSFEALGDVQFYPKQKALRRINQALAHDGDVKPKADIRIIYRWIWPLSGLFLIPEERKNSGTSAYASVQEAALNLWITCVILLKKFKPLFKVQSVISNLLPFLEKVEVKQNNSFWLPIKALRATPRLGERLLTHILSKTTFYDIDLVPIIRDQILVIATSNPIDLKLQLASACFIFLARSGFGWNESIVLPIIPYLRHKLANIRENARRLLKVALLASWPIEDVFSSILKLVHSQITPKSARHFVSIMAKDEGLIESEIHHHGGILRHLTSFTIAELLDYIQPTIVEQKVINFDSFVVSRFVFIFVEAAFGNIAREKSSHDWVHKAVEIRQHRAPKALGILSSLLSGEQILDTFLPMLYKAIENVVSNEQSDHASKLKEITTAKAIMRFVSGSLKKNRAINDFIEPLLSHVHDVIRPLVDSELSHNKAKIIIGQFGLSLLAQESDSFNQVGVFSEDFPSVNTKVTALEIFGPILLKIIQQGSAKFPIDGDSIVSEAMRLIGHLYAKWKRHSSETTNTSLGHRLMAQAISVASKLIIKERPEDVHSSLASASFSLMTAGVGNKELLGDSLLRSILASPRFSDKDIFSNMLLNTTCAAGIGPFLRRFYANRQLASEEPFIIAEQLLDKLVHGPTSAIRSTALDSLSSFLQFYPFSDKKRRQWLQIIIAQLDHSWEEARIFIIRLLELLFNYWIKNDSIGKENFVESMRVLQETLVLKLLLLSIQDFSSSVQKAAGNLLTLIFDSSCNTVVINQLFALCNTWLDTDQPKQIQNVAIHAILKLHNSSRLPYQNISSSLKNSLYSKLKLIALDLGPKSSPADNPITLSMVESALDLLKT